jgi:hypothetical protein
LHCGYLGDLRFDTGERSSSRKLVAPFTSATWQKRESVGVDEPVARPASEHVTATRIPRWPGEGFLCRGEESETWVLVTESADKRFKLRKSCPRLVICPATRPTAASYKAWNLRTIDRLAKVLPRGSRIKRAQLAEIWFESWLRLCLAQTCGNQVKAFGSETPTTPEWTGA